MTTMTGLADQPAKILTGLNFTTAGAPLITSLGDADGSNRGFDLWFTRSDNALWK
ncbi:hypothetical protein ACF063_05925 [Streptomyces chartreusis]|uniref:hypothetical protein n=1 Tax=Streptomyces chartreusis TaxID=1969 RepID=UPI0036F9468E